MLVNHDELLMSFRGAYGRLCVLTAAALANGHNQQNVMDAARGKGNALAPVYEALRRQRRRVNDATDACQMAGVTTAAFVEVGTQAFHTAQQEWHIRIPLFTEAANA